MPVTTIDSRQVHVNEEGFLTDPASGTRPSAAPWPPRSASSWATSTGRRSASCARTSPRRGETPTLRRVTVAGGIPTKELFQLFPQKPAKKMAYIAGLPKPHGCV